MSRKSLPGITASGKQAATEAHNKHQGNEYTRERRKDMTKKKIEEMTTEELTRAELIRKEREARIRKKRKIIVDILLIILAIATIIIIKKTWSEIEKDLDTINHNVEILS